ncbi:MAG: hypothetical protein QM811_27990 [Pirellulales bacterium]
MADACPSVAQHENRAAALAASGTGIDAAEIVTGVTGDQQASAAHLRSGRVPDVAAHDQCSTGHFRAAIMSCGTIDFDSARLHSDSEEINLRTIAAKEQGSIIGTRTGDLEQRA